MNNKAKAEITEARVIVCNLGCGSCSSLQWWGQLEVEVQDRSRKSVQKS
jgi:hypothetical protein